MKEEFKPEYEFKPKFKSGVNNKGMLEQTVTEKGREDYPLLRAVNMDAFSSNRKRDKYLVEKELMIWKRGKEEFESSVRATISNACLEHYGKPSLGFAIPKCLSERLQIPIENISVTVDDDFLGFMLEIKATKYGDIKLDYTH